MLSERSPWVKDCLRQYSVRFLRMFTHSDQPKTWFQPKLSSRYDRSSNKKWPYVLTWSKAKHSHQLITSLHNISIRDLDGVLTGPDSFTPPPGAATSVSCGDTRSEKIDSVLHWSLSTTPLSGVVCHAKSREMQGESHSSPFLSRLAFSLENLTPVPQSFRTQYG